MKLRRSTSPPVGDGDHDGCVPGTSTTACAMRTPLLNHNTAVVVKPTIAGPKRKLPLLNVAAAAILLLVLLLLSPCIYFLLLYFRQPIRDQSCPVPEWTFPECSSQLLHDYGTEIPPLVTPQEFLQFRRQYHESVTPGGVSSMTSDWGNLTKVRALDGQVVDNTGFLLPVQFQYSPGKGRGIYATAPISKGAQIWDSRYRAVFDTECQARTFLSKLSNSDQCKVMFWGYSNNFYGNGFQFMVDFDGHGYMNHCEATSPARNTAHFFEGEPLDNPYSTLPHFFAYDLVWARTVDHTTLLKRNYPGAHGMYATRDIAAGEELCFDYDEIHANVLLDYYSQLWTHSLKIIHWWNL